MDSSCLFYICLISSLHCLLVTWLVVAIDTPTTESNDDSTALPNSSSKSTEDYHTTVVTGLGKEATSLDNNKGFKDTDNNTTQIIDTTNDKTKGLFNVTTNIYATIQKTEDTSKPTNNISTDIAVKVSSLTDSNVNMTKDAINAIVNRTYEDTTHTNIITEPNNGTTADATTQPAAKTTKSTAKSILDFMPACPPPNNLHQLCNVSLGNITCSERAIVFKSCYNTYASLYTDSSWNACVSPEDKCEEIVNILEAENLIGKDANAPTSHTYHFANVTVPFDESHTGKVTNSPYVVTKGSKPVSSDNTSAKHSVEVTTVEDAVTEMTSNPAKSDSDNPVTLSPTISPSQSPPVAEESNSHGSYPCDPLTWLYALIMCLIILLEIIVLWYFFWYRQKKYNSSPVGRYRRASTGSMVIQEDIIDPESTSPTKALYVNKEYDEDQALKEDEKIFNSYLNLRFIDDTSVEGTPERALIK